ncbi:hypothetical protein JYU34_011425 [Plutella xylostella]|uniref:Uncharacterized protein n=1 Tax=Plutella xylostella TaxID=51655 RepID=A0ABQ7QGX4_PLUXY|nr:hypothetical protein JYU34_011425 [Plutella xylostella]
MRRTVARNAPTYTWIHSRGFFTSRHGQSLTPAATRADTHTHSRGAGQLGLCSGRGQSGRVLAGTSADTRPPCAAVTGGRARARALRRSLRPGPSARELSRRGGEQTRRASPSYTKTRLKRIYTFSVR